MPELPEVETIVRDLAPVVRGRRIGSVWWSGKPLHLLREVDVAGLRRLAVARKIRRVRRRGKYIVVEVEGEGDPGIIVHLGMTGRLGVVAATRPRPAHAHVAFDIGGGDELRFVDPRRFGWVEPAASIAANAALAALGPDPLSELDAETLAAQLARSRAPIKAFLLDQRRIAGVGNIYASEALHRAGIHPGVPAMRVRRRARALLAGVRAALEGGIARRGTTLRDYRDANGMPGLNAVALLVYGRGGAPCTRCGAIVRRRIDGGRATFYCPRCQRR